jgi:hypothetical protein
MALKMRQSLAQIEQAFRYEAELDQKRREHLRRKAIHRSQVRRIEREKKRGTLRFWLLVMTLVATALVVTVAMFATLYLLLS